MRRAFLAGSAASLALLFAVTARLPAVGVPRSPVEAEQVVTCRIVAPIAAEVRRSAGARCRDALKRIEAKLAILPSVPRVTITESDGVGASTTDPPGRFELRMRVPSLDSLPVIIAKGLLDHEVGHFAVISWLEDSVGDIADGGYGTRLPDILDEGLAILAEPSGTRAGRRRAFSGIDAPSLREILDLTHPPRGSSGSTTQRTVASPCRGVCDRLHADQWMVVTERWTVVPNGPDLHEVDTVFSTERPPELELDPKTRFDALSEAVISFLEKEFGAPSALRDFVLVLIDPSRSGLETMEELTTKLGVSESVLELRWSEWAQVTTEVVGRSP